MSNRSSSPRIVLHAKRKILDDFTHPHTAIPSELKFHFALDGYHEIEYASGSFTFQKSATPCRAGWSRNFSKLEEGVCMRSVCVVPKLILAAFCLLLFASLAFGQGGTGTITGTVTDPTGLAVAGANVEARNIDTSVVYNGA